MDTSRNNCLGKLSTRLGSLPRELAVWGIALLPVVVLFYAASCDAPDPKEMLFDAAQHGNIESLNSALCRGARIDDVDDTGFTPLMIAARAGQADVVECLLDRGANPDCVHQVCGTALMQASLYGNAECVRILLAHHADPNVRNAIGRNAVANALAANPPVPQIVDALVQAGGVRPCLKRTSR